MSAGIKQHTFISIILVCNLCCGAPGTVADVRVADVGTAMTVQLRHRVADPTANYLVKWRAERWDPAATALIICDMWDAHHCYNATQRVKELAPRIDALAEHLRSRGVLIIHAPSSCMAAYEEHPARQRAKTVPQSASLPDDIDKSCNQIAAESSAKYPIDQSDGGCDDDPRTQQKWHDVLQAMGKNPDAPWSRQIDTIRIDVTDAISDRGSEIWNLLHQKGIRNVLLVGVHTNMCVLARPFGLRQLARNGINVALVRDLTDTMYNPDQWPFVSHFSGTDRIVEHIEKYICPTIESSQIIGGAPFRFHDDHRTVVAIVVSENEYDTSRTLPQFMAAHLGRDFAVRMTLNHDIQSSSIEGLDEVLQGADLLLLSVWRRVLPAAQLVALRAHIDAGRAVVGIRTSSHAFVPRDPAQTQPGLATWPDFDRAVLGAHYVGHHGNKAEEGGPRTLVRCVLSQPPHPILQGIPVDEFVVPSWLYKVQPLADTAVPLMMGRVEGRLPEEPVAWTNRLPGGTRVFYTSLGHPQEFADVRFQRLLFNGVYWAAGRTVPGMFDPNNE